VKPKGNRPLGKYLGVEGTIILKWIFKKWNGRARNGLIPLRIGTGGGLLCKQCQAFTFHKIRENLD
jgi:hypothetical protein